MEEPHKKMQKIHTHLVKFEDKPIIGNGWGPSHVMSLMWSIGNFKYVADEMMVVRNHMQQIVKRRGSVLKCMCEFCLVDSKWIQPNFQVF